jgi:ADP-heptose:LPS heptosyltransferase
MKDIVIAPFSNSDIRDWPVEHFAALAGLLLEDLESDDRITVVGTRAQRLRGNEIVRAYDPARVVNACGWHTWPRLVEELKTASCVVGNNSGVTHLSGFHGVPTVCVFGGSHQRLEWRPLGFSVSVVTRSIGCSPCQLDHGQTSPYAKACLRHIEPRLVAETVFATMERVLAAKAAGAPNGATAREDRADAVCIEELG